MTALRKVVDSNTLTTIFDLPSDYKNKMVEVIMFPVPESTGEKKPHFTMTQIEEWTKSPDIQSLVGALKTDDLPADINISDIRKERLAEKYKI